jgi:hypothetical protein
MNVGTPGGKCIGAIMHLGNSSDAAYWMLGDAFLVRNYNALRWSKTLICKAIPQKNVYTVLRMSPPSVGFAQLTISELTSFSSSSLISTATVTANISSTASESSIFLLLNNIDTHIWSCPSAY